MFREKLKILINIALFFCVEGVFDLSLVHSSGCWCKLVILVSKITDCVASRFQHSVHFMKYNVADCLMHYRFWSVWWFCIGGSIYHQNVHHSVCRVCTGP